MADHNEFGRAAEALAAERLQSAGWTVLHRNWRWHRRELDIVARQGRTVAFVEVRARSTTGHGHPLETVGWRKQRDIEAAGLAWIRRHGGPRDVYRLDVVTVVAPDGDMRYAVVDHVADAWRVR